MAALTGRVRFQELNVTPGLMGVAVIVTATTLVAAVGGAVTAPNVGSWYEHLPKPDWTPPNWVFGPVWTVMYALMAVAASIVWVSRACDDICCPLSAFGAQLVLNLAWSVCFFGLHSPLLGFLDVCLLWVLVGVTVAEFFLVSRVAGLLLIPYWLWVTFAAILNAAIVMKGS
ncbi:TspO/MBR family protein [Gemmata obscuriglobus]|uniref:TspO/MBR family protein n=1 Tax=Gemmata obscuriglobus TaxID=114 RepID=UPI0011CD0861|nr:TspO/MBR family protein [Gemmata obscuriglobus]QEG28285.1 TspO/MBR family protein [Gemmata obscuriglobus]VTS06105.1 and mbr : Integral membrane protein OS=Blastopirellula marina DSM 3645 GN=DSM3645_17575 PE=4 SV=1: TspO_MBR [Gemmata obscuriglobus UQM 2246]